MIKDKKMLSNLWIISGVLAGAFAAYAIPHGFQLRENKQPNKSTFVKQNMQNSPGGVQVGRDLTQNFYSDEKIRKKLPDDLDIYVTDDIDFKAPKTVVVDSEKAKIEFKITKIYEKDSKFYITFFVNIDNKITNSAWLSQTSEAEITNDTLATVKTDMFELYFYVLNTELNKAKVALGAKIVPTGWIFYNIRIQGNAIKFN